MTGREFICRFQIILFFALSLFAWTIWGAQAAYKHGLLGWAPTLQSPLNALTVWSPGLAAMLLAGLTLGKSQVGALFRPLLQWRVAPKWYVVALLFEPAKWLLAYGIDRAVGQTYQLESVPLLKTFGAASTFMIPIALLFTLPNSLGEELGWRGFALPRLMQKWGALIASVVIGLFWGFWHIPMWLTWSKNELSWISLAIMILNMVPAAVLFTWVYLKTRGSLLLVCLLHASTAVKGYLMPNLPTLTQSAILWIAAVLVVAFGGLVTTNSVEIGSSKH